MSTDRIRLDHGVDFMPQAVQAQSWIGKAESFLYLCLSVLICVHLRSALLFAFVFWC